MSLLVKRPYVPPPPAATTAHAKHERAKDLIEEANELLVHAREQYGAMVERHTAEIADLRAATSECMQQISEINDYLDVLP